MPGQAQWHCNVACTHPEKHTLDKTVDIELTAHHFNLDANRESGRIVGGIFDQGKRIVRPGFGLQRITARLRIQPFRKLSLRAIEESLSRTKIRGGGLLCARFLGGRDCLPGVAHLLNRRRCAAARSNEQDHDQQTASDHTGKYPGVLNSRKDAHPGTLTSADARRQAVAAALTDRSAAATVASRQFSTKNEPIMKVTIYHNPACSKSRKTLEIMEAQGLRPRIVKYLDEPPAPDTLLRLARMLDMPLAGLLRTSESDFSESPTPVPVNDVQALSHWLHEHPRVLQRPIVVDEEGDRAIIGRPPENVLELLSP